MEVQVLNAAGQNKGKAELPDALFAVEKVNKHLLHEIVRAYLANQRKGTHSTLTRTEVSGGGKKPWKQKHTGRARSGSSRSPLWRGGGIIQGPKPRDYRIDVPQAKIKSALSHALTSKAGAGNIVVSEKPKMTDSKTKTVSEWLKKLSLPSKTLLVLDKKDEKLSMASRNLKDFNWIECKHLHPYHVLKAKKIIFTPEAIQCL